MNDLFFSVFTDGIAQCLADRDMSLSRVMPRLEKTKKRATLCWKIGPNLHCFASFYLGGGANTVKLAVSWSTNSKVPSRLDNERHFQWLREKLNGHPQPLSNLLDCDTMWLSALEFGRQQDGWRIPNSFATVERAADLYEQPKVAELLSDIGAEDWQSDETMLLWDTLEATAKDCGLPGLTADDAECALGDLAKEMFSFFEIKMYPLLKELVGTRNQG